MNAETTKCYLVGADPDTDPAIAQAAQLLRSGQLVAFPTETVYGLGADASSREAVGRIFAAKNRPEDNPLIVHIADATLVERFCAKIPAELELLAKAFWPGPLTLVVSARPELRGTVCRGLKTVALRVPNHPVALALLRRADLGVAAPSANISGRPSPTRAEHVMADMNGRIPMILDGGPCKQGIESTVLDLAGREISILRPGIVTAEELSDVLGRPVHHSSAEKRKRRSPGTRYRHYSPNAEVILLGAGVSQKAFTAFMTDLVQKAESVGYLGSRKLPPGNVKAQQVPPDQMAAQLYQGLRQMDDAGVATIVVDGVEASGVGLSVMDRLCKAASIVLENDAQVFGEIG